jgi:superfamily II DNA or RNA helicase
MANDTQKDHTIYMWSTERYKDETQRTKDGKYFPVLAKVGETKEFRAEVRVAQTDSTGVAETPVLLKQWHIPAQYRDKYLHTLLAKKGYPKNRDDKDREWIYFTGCKSSEDAVKVMDRLINEVLTGKSAITNYPLFDYQKDIVSWAVDRYNQGDQKVLINAIMRAGKCLISHAIVKALGFKKVLIVTGKPGAIPSWSVLSQGGEEEHVDYNNYIFHDYDHLKKTTINFGKGDCDLVAISLQFASRHLGAGTSKLLNQIVSTDWDLVIFDEQHFATNTEKTKTFWENLKSKFWVELSGTPYKTLLSNRFTEGSIYSFDYIDEQKIRGQLLLDAKEDEQTRQFKYKARIDWALISVPEKIKTMANGENFNLGARGIFSTAGASLKYRDAVNELINHVKLRGYKNLPEKFDNNVEKVTKHSLWVLPKNVKAIKLVAKMLQEHPYFKKYDVVIATGSSDEAQASVKDIDDVKARIAAVESGKSDYIGTITLTCGRFLEGTSVPEWWAVHQINDAKSAEDYFQGSFRCKTPWVKGNKTDVVVFDYNPERFISVMYQHIERKADATERPTEEVAAEFTECSDIYDYSDNGWKVIDGAELQKQFLSNIKNYTDRVGYLVKSENITDDIRALLEGKNEDSNSVLAKSQLNQNDLTRGSNQKKSNNGDPAVDDTDEDTDEDTEAKIRFALKQVYELVNVAWAEGTIVNSMTDVIDYKDIGLVYEITGLSPSEWKSILPAVDVIGMNRAIGQFNAF